MPRWATVLQFVTGGGSEWPPRPSFRRALAIFQWSLHTKVWLRRIGLPANILFLRPGETSREITFPVGQDRVLVFIRFVPPMFLHYSLSWNFSGEFISQTLWREEWLRNK
jgi:hypothetical protein